VEPLLAIDELRYARVTATDPDERNFALHIPELRLYPGQAAGVVGPSGCGKSTLVDLLALLRRPAKVARFTFLEHDIARVGAQCDFSACTAIRARHIGVVLQTGGLLPSLPVWENILISQRLLGLPDPVLAKSLIATLDIEGLERRLPAQLSIGQRQRVAIARALAHSPALVIADEPTASLGVEHASAALELLKSLTTKYGAGLIVVSHDAELLERKGLEVWRCCVNRGITTIVVPK